MQHLSCSLSSTKVKNVKISLKQQWIDSTMTKMTTDLTMISRKKQFCSKFKSHQMDTTFISKSNDRQSYIVLALITGRGKLKNEVGLAVLDLHYPCLTLYQITDSFLYSYTLAKINTYEPSEIIMPERFLNENYDTTSLYNKITHKFKKEIITFVPLQHFSALIGWDLIQIYCTKSSSTKKIIKQKYYALSSASALLKYTTNSRNLIFAPKSVMLDFQTDKYSITLDIESVELLELIYSLNPAIPAYSLYNALNKCVTPLGKKLLRSSLLQPLHNISIINERVECVIEFVSNYSFLMKLQITLKKMSSIGKLLNIAFKLNKFDNVQQAEDNLNYILLLKNILDFIPELRTIIGQISSSFFYEMKHNFEDNGLNEIKRLVIELIQIDANYVQGYTSSNMQRCFAIKPKISELLDIIRQAYCELIDNMIQYVENLNKKFSLQLSLGCNSTDGYYIQINVPQNEKYDLWNLPENFIILKENLYTLFITTEKLLVDSQKCKEICEEIHIMSNVIIEKLIDKLRIYTDKFFQLCTDIGKLDFIMCLALISKISGFIRPVFSQKLCIIESQHPIQFMLGFEIGVSNNIIASIPYNFQLITGPNLSGKTTYLKQIILLHIMAQIGCFIPAQKAMIRACDRFFFHSSNYYYSGNDISIYKYEMKKLNQITNYLTDYSLVALDEPCMKTATKDGICLAVSICIKILKTQAICFCVTHINYLTRIAESYLNVTNLHFNCSSRIIEKYSWFDSTRLSLIYTYKLKIGTTKINNYGLTLAESSSLPNSVLQKAKLIIQTSVKNEMENNVFQRIENLQLEKVYLFMAKIYNLIIAKKFTITAVMKFLKQYFNLENFYINEKSFKTIFQFKPNSYFLKEISTIKKNSLFKKHELIIKQLKKHSNYLYNICKFNQNQNNTKLIQFDSIQNLQLCKSKNYKKLISIYKKSNVFCHLNYILSRQRENSIAKQKKQFSFIPFLLSFEQRNLLSILIQIYIKNKSNYSSSKKKQFNVYLFYKKLLDINLCL